MSFGSAGPDRYFIVIYQYITLDSQIDVDLLAWSAPITVFPFIVISISC